MSADRLDLVNQKELARRLGVSPSTLRRWLKERHFPPSVNGRWHWPSVKKVVFDAFARATEDELGADHGYTRCLRALANGISGSENVSS